MYPNIKGDKFFLEPNMIDMILLALKSKFNETHDAGWLGLQVNLEGQQKSILELKEKKKKK